MDMRDDVVSIHIVKHVKSTRYIITIIYRSLLHVNRKTQKRKNKDEP